MKRTIASLRPQAFLKPLSLFSKESIPMEDKGFQVGDRVLSEQIIPCACCRYCKDGDYNLCIPPIPSFRP